MKLRAIIFLGVISVLVACTKGNGDDTPQQTIVTVDSSGVSGRLYVEVYDVNGNDISGADVSLFITKDDMMNNIPLYKFTSSTSGRVDFGYVLQGNYYVTGANRIGSGTMHDTTVAQVLPKRVLTRKLILQ